MNTPEIILTDDQRNELTQISSNISSWEIAKYYTFSETDLEIINQHRRNHNRLGFAIQLCCLRYPGWPLANMDHIPQTVLSYVAAQLEVEPDTFSKYGQREMTPINHLGELREVYGFRYFDDTDHASLENFLIPYALENDHVLRLVKLAIEQLRVQKVILPGITTIEKIVNRVCVTAENKIYAIVNRSLTAKQKKQLDEIIRTKEDAQITVLAYLKEEPGQSSPQAFINIIERLKVIRKLKLNVDLTEIHPNRLKQLSRLGSKYEPHSFRRFREEKRYAVLVVYLQDLQQRLIDFAVEIHDRQIAILLSGGRKRQDEIQKQNGKSLNEKIIHYINIGSALIKSRKDGLEPFAVIETVMTWDRFIESVEEAKKLTRPQSYDYLDLLGSRYNQLRKYTPALVKYLQFSSTGTSSGNLIKALSIINELNESGKRKIPDDAPLDFIPNRWEKYIFDRDGSINRHYYELATYTELKNRIRSGDIAVEGSRNYRKFDEYLLPVKEWKAGETVPGTLAVSADFDEYMQERNNSMNNRQKWLSDNISLLNCIDLTEGKIHVEKLYRETPDEALQLSERLYSILPHVKLADLILEVSGWTGFDRHFTHASTGGIVQSTEKPVVMAALMAMGTNIGLANNE